MQTVKLVILLTLLFDYHSCLSEDAKELFPRVSTPLGNIEGYYKTSSNGPQFEAYEGIRYAEPPTGSSRFEVPRPVSPWQGVLMAKNFGPICMQYNPALISKVEGEEDCLFINVYTTAHRRNETNGEVTKLLPVLVYIHGGGFRYGSGSENGPKYLMNEALTLVTFNYRLGPLGFLSTEDEVVPGNMGLKDQVVALRWVKDNIQSFGGDASKITLVGNSAGGASVHYHYLTNLTVDLFRGGISLSGNALHGWAQTEAPLEKAKKLAAIVGCPTDGVQNMVDCLKTRPAREIVQNLDEFMPWMNNPFDPFGPVVEKGGGEFTFIDRTPIDIITSSDAQDLPWITGVVSDESLIVTAALITNASLLEELNLNWEEYAVYMLDYNYTIPAEDHPKVARSMKEHYLGERPISMSTGNEIVKLASDRLVFYHAGEAAKLHARYSQSPVRFYYFSYRGAHSFSELFSSSNQNLGVCHMDDLAYVLELPINTTTTPEDRAMQKKLVDLWVSFATDLTPKIGVEWPVVTRVTEELNYLHIAGPSKLYMESSSNFGEKDFWNSIGFQENNQTVIISNITSISSKPE